MNTQPDALRLAGIIEQFGGASAYEAAAELRRLHAENAALQQGYDAARLEIDHLRGGTHSKLLAQPVAWMVYLPSIDTQHLYYSQEDMGYVDDVTNHADAEVTPLYEMAAPKAEVAPQLAPAPSAVADLIAALEEARSAINSMKVEAETAGQGDEQMMLEACETISNEGLQADMAIRAALASAPKPSSTPQADSVLEDAARYRFLAAHCRSTSEHWGGRWSIIIDGPAPKSHDGEDDFDEAVDAARKKGATHD